MLNVSACTGDPNIELPFPGTCGTFVYVLSFLVGTIPILCSFLLVLKSMLLVVT